MRLLVQFQNVRIAYAFADYLNVNGVRCKVEKDSDKANLYILNESDIHKAKTELEEFIKNPADKKYLSASWEQEAADTGDNANQRDTIGEIYQQKDGSAKKRWQRTGIFTKLIIGVCALVFFITAFGTDRSTVKYFFFFNYWGQMYDVSQIWRWISPVFLHFGFLHFTFNLLWWWDIASLIERLQGSLRLVYIFLVLSVFSNFTQFIAAGPRFGGLSGVVFGVLGYVWVYGQVRKDYPLQLRPVIMYMMVGWMLIGFSGALDNVVGPMANEAHLAGLVTGALLGVIFGLQDRAKAKLSA